MKTKTFTLILFLPALARAASEEGEHAAHAETSITDLLWATINFALFLFLFFRFAWPSLKQALADRRQAIEGRLAEADEAFREAEQELQDVQVLKARQGEDARTLLEEVRHDAEKHRQSLVEAARRTAERIREDARLVAESEAARAARELRADFASRVIDEATATLRERIGDQDHERFIEGFLGEVESEVAEAGR